MEGQKKRGFAVAAASPPKTPEQLHQRSLQRYSKAKARSNDMARFISEFEPKKAKKLEDCGSFLVFHHYYTVGVYRVVKASFCRQYKLCQMCGIRRGGKAIHEFLPKYKAIMTEDPDLRPYHITLTVKNGFDLGERLTHLQNGQKTLNQRRLNAKKGRSSASQWTGVVASIGGIEITYDYRARTGRKTGWHPHIHQIVLSDRPIEEKKLRQEWQEITSDSHQIAVVPIADTDEETLLKNLCEVFKYAVKFGEMENLQVYEAAVLTHKRRLVFSTGLFRGFKMPEELTDDKMEELPFIELLYRYCTEKGYLLQSKDAD